MRSTLLQRYRRTCPLCGNVGFALTGYDFYHRPTFECNACRHEWVAYQGGRAKGSARHRLVTEDATDE